MDTIKKRYERRIDRIRDSADRQIKRLTTELEKKQAACPHSKVDNPGSILGETCSICGLYLNNGV